jgi:hypothetical protein
MVNDQTGFAGIHASFWLTSGQKEVCPIISTSGRIAPLVQSPALPGNQQYLNRDSIWY